MKRRFKIAALILLPIALFAAMRELVSWHPKKVGEAPENAETWGIDFVASPNFVAAYSFSEVQIFDARSGRQIAHKRIPGSRLLNAAFSDDGQKLWMARIRYDGRFGYNGDILCFSPTLQPLAPRFQAAERPLDWNYGVPFGLSQKGLQLKVGGHIWDVETGKLETQARDSFSFAERNLAVSRAKSQFFRRANRQENGGMDTFAPQANRAVLRRNERWEVRRFPNGTLLKTLPSNQIPHSVQILPDGSALFWADENGSLWRQRIW